MVTSSFSTSLILGFMFSNLCSRNAGTVWTSKPTTLSLSPRSLSAPRNVFISSAGVFQPRMSLTQVRSLANSTSV